MSKPSVLFHNIETGEIFEREMNAEEFAQYEIDQANVKIEREQEETRIKAKEAVLAKLGLTAEEVAVLLG